MQIMRAESPIFSIAHGNALGYGLLPFQGVSLMTFDTPSSYYM